MITIKQQKITIINSGKPIKKSLNDELRWFGSSLGLFNLRDKDKSCFRLFIELLKNTKNEQTASSDELAYKTHLTRGTVVHHLNKLIERGIVIREGKKYILRVSNLEILVDEIKLDIERTCSNLKEVAKNIDKFLGL